MAHRILTILFLLLVEVAYAQHAGKPILYLEGNVSTNLSQRDMAMSPDGNEMFYTMVANQNAFTVIIHRRRLPNRTWSLPQVASFSGKYPDLEPAFSADGKKVFFSSSRATDGGVTLKDYDIWYSEKVNGKWGLAKNIGKPINTSANEFYPSPARNGNLYFTAEYDKGFGKEDIYVSRFVNGAYMESEPLDTLINSETWEFNAFISPDEDFILFTSQGRKDDKGGGDLYIALKDTAGKWKAAKNLTTLNSNKLDYCPFVDYAKKTMYFTSKRHAIPRVQANPITYSEVIRLFTQTQNGSENIYWVKWEELLHIIDK